MKAVKKFIVLLVGAFLAVAASASTLEQTYLDTCIKDPGVPVPVSVVSPEVGPQYNGASVVLEFLVDKDGKPAEFTIKSSTSSDDVLAMTVVKAVKQWRFMPAAVDGKPIAKKVSLPVKIVDPEAQETGFAVFN